MRSLLANGAFALRTHAEAIGNLDLGAGTAGKTQQTRGLGVLASV